MESKEDLLSIYEQYVHLYPKEIETLIQFKNFIDDTNSEHLYIRKNFVGHITASALIIDYTTSNILLINHKSLKRWLQPGGHVESSDISILASSLRECEEETGINSNQLMLISNGISEAIPIDIDSHFIPKNDHKDEIEHYHHDFRYLFLYKGGTNVEIDLNEVNGYQWVAFEELSRDVTFSNLVEKIRRFLSFEHRTKLYYDKIISLLNYKEECEALVVSHIIPDCIYYLQAVNKVFPIKSIIPKPNSINRNIYTIIEKEFRIDSIHRNNMDNNGNAIVKYLLESERKLIIFDIGGYFSKIHFGWPKEILERIVLVIEDTENGHQKYEKQVCPFKIVSVARSPLKDNEDFLVGQSVLFSADAILRGGGTLIQYMNCSVIGYGKIGRSISYHLLQRGVKPSVYDTNPIKRLSAFNELSSIPERDYIIKNSDVIFSATGNQCLGINDFRNLKNGCFIFSVTSSDDELNLKFLNGEYKKEEVREHIFKYFNSRNYFFLVNEGNAVNFIHSAIMANFIHLVRSEMILSLNELSKYEFNEINEVSNEIRKTIAELWIKIFDPEHRNLSNIEYIL
ncbi:MAG: NUDIX domain-containing protein [Saprospiraceae bacterium]